MVGIVSFSISQAYWYLRQYSETYHCPQNENSGIHEPILSRDTIQLGGAIHGKLSFRNSVIRVSRIFQHWPLSLALRQDLTNVLFLCFFYSALFPSAFFFCGATLIVQYYSDKYCLMVRNYSDCKHQLPPSIVSRHGSQRIWSSAPFLGAKLAIFSRRYFFSGALLAFVIASGYDWAQFPYDNLCDPESPTYGNNRTFDNVVFLDPKLNAEGPSSITVTQPTNVVGCNQDWRGLQGFPFPSTASRLQSPGREWMTGQQVRLWFPSLNFFWSCISYFVPH